LQKSAIYVSEAGPKKNEHKSSSTKLNAHKNHHKSGRSVDAADVATQFEKF